MGSREDKPAQEITRKAPARRKTETATGEDGLLGVTLTHPEKVLFPDCGVTKRDLAEYLTAAAPYLLPYAADRFVSLVRCPEGIGHEGFFQRHPGRGMDASWLHAPVQTAHGTEDYLYFTDGRALPAAAQLSVIEFHIWGSDRAHLEQPNRIVFDLDPDEGLPFARVRDTAFVMRESLEALGLHSLPLLSGGRGIHVVVPIRPEHDWPAIKAFAGALSRRLAADRPDRYVATMSKAKRKGRVFIDHFRNERGATAIAPFSPRARPGAPVAWPVSWDDLGGIKTANPVHLKDAAAMLHQAQAAWQGEEAAPQRLTAAMLAAVSG